MRPAIRRITLRSLTELDLVPGREVYAVIKSVALDRHSLGIGRGRGGEGDFDETVDG